MLLLVIDCWLLIINPEAAGVLFSDVLGVTTDTFWLVLYAGGMLFCCLLLYWRFLYGGGISLATMPRRNISSLSGLLLFSAVTDCLVVFGVAEPGCILPACHSLNCKPLPRQKKPCKSHIFHWGFIYLAIYGVVGCRTILLFVMACRCRCAQRSILLDCDKFIPNWVRLMYSRLLGTMFWVSPPAWVCRYRN